jgi:DNA-binding MltR family transcriptional regulator
MRVRRPKPPGPPKPPPPPSRATLLKSLKDLSRLLPEEQERVNHIIQLAIHADHTAAITSVACLEQAFKTAISRHLRQNISPDDEKRIFEYSSNGMLATLDSRIKMSYALGIIEADERDDLDTIRNIRNAFAHSGSIITFMTGNIPALVSSLKIFNRKYMNDGLHQLETKRKFIFAVATYYVRLITWLPAHPERNRHWTENKETESSSP